MVQPQSAWEKAVPGAQLRSPSKSRDLYLQGSRLDDWKRLQVVIPLLTMEATHLASLMHPEFTSHCSVTKLKVVPALHCFCTYCNSPTESHCQ